MKIVVRNTCILINDYDIGDCPELEKIFKIFDPITHTFNTWGMYYDKETRRLFLPAGLDLWKIRGYFNQKYYDRISEHKYKSIDNIMIKYKPRDEEQIKALSFMVGVNEYEDNMHLNQLSVNLNTGKGKTYCSIATICYFKIKSIVITGSNTLLNQWRSEILHYTNLKDNEVIQIVGSEAINMILQNRSKKAQEGKIFLCSHGTLRSFGDTYGWEKVYDLFEILGVGIKIFDEAHTNFSNMLMIDFFTNVWKTYYVTATPGRSSWAENKIFQLSLKNVPSIDLFDENNDPHTDYIAIKWNSHPTPQQISACKSKYGIDRMKYVDYVTKQSSFYEMLRIIMEMVIKCNGRVLFYIGTNDAILRVYYWICNNYPEFLGDIGIFTSLLSKEEKMKEKQKKLILSTTKSAGLGEHIEGLKMTIVLAEIFKSEIISRQTLGRTRNPNTLYVELVDLGFYYCKKYYQDKLPVFNKYAQSVSDTLIDNYEMHRRAFNIIKNRETIAESPIVFCDNRFDFSKYEPKKQPEVGPICPLLFFDNKDCNPYI